MSAPLITHYTVNTDKHTPCHLAGFFHEGGHLYPCTKGEAPAVFEINQASVLELSRTSRRNIRLKSVKRIIERTAAVSKQLAGSRMADWPKAEALLAVNSFVIVQHRSDGTARRLKFRPIKKRARQGRKDATAGLELFSLNITK